MKTRNKIKLVILLIEIIIIAFVFKNFKDFKKIIYPNVIPLVEKVTEEIKIIPTLTPVLEEINIPTKVEIKKPVKATPTINNEPWGISKQIDDVTWTIKVGEDEKMATEKEILDALNEYRRVHGSQILTLNEKLVNYAQERAKYLNGIKSVDQHEGFNDFVTNQDGFNKLGFTSLGENISYGYKLNGVHIIEWMYAGDEPHDNNQLNNRWNYVGIGVDGLATCLIFGTGKF
jgi:uncharacterized protein YkwD